jgi:cytochrome P450
MEVSEPDVLSHLLEETKNAEDKRGDFYWLSGDSRLIIVAGSDTTSTTLTHVFYHLANDPTQMAKLRAELKSLVKSEKEFDVKDVRDAEHLNGVINETLRLHPPVPTGVYRLTPPEGIMVGDTYIPGEVTVITPNYTLGRCQSLTIPLALIVTHHRPLTKDRFAKLTCA